VTLKEDDMRKRLVLLTVAGLALLGPTCGLLYWIDLNRPGVTQANFERIQRGMTLAEVEALMGRPGQPMPPPPSAHKESSLTDKTWWEGDVIVGVLVDRCEPTADRSVFADR
jgi:hypothetical protein